jgi:hypothetical protein
MQPFMLASMHTDARLAGRSTLYFGAAPADRNRYFRSMPDVTGYTFLTFVQS